MKPILPLALACATLAGCSTPDPDGPPMIRLGMDECAACGMIIAEDKSAAALAFDGSPAALFDDLGCLLDYRDDHPGVPARRVWVHDYATRAWIDGSTAACLRAAPGTITTPMGSGMVAFASIDAARAEHARAGGDVGALDDLAALRRAWREARRAQYADPPGK
jgi:copper chaperone NosL